MGTCVSFLKRRKLVKWELCCSFAAGFFIKSLTKRQADLKGRKFCLQKVEFVHTREKWFFLFEQSKTSLEPDFHVNPLSPNRPQNPIFPCGVLSVLLPFNFSPFFFTAVVAVAFLVKVLDVVSATQSPQQYHHLNLLFVVPI